MAQYGPKAKAFIDRPVKHDRFINILHGAVRSGKTWAMIPKLLKCCYYPVAGHRVIAGISKQTVYRNILSDLFDFIGSHRYSYNRQTGELNLCGVPWQVIGAKDEGSERYIRGMTIGVAYIDEATEIPQSAFDMLRSRLSPAGARLYMTTNPDTPYHHIKTGLLDKTELYERGDLWAEHFVMDDNLSLSQETRDRYARMYTGVFYQRFILGLWVIAEGAIYKDALGPQTWFADATRPIGLLGAGGHTARYIGIDYGTTNPCVFLEVYDDGRTLWQTREYYWDSRTAMRQKTDAEYASDLESFAGPNRRGLTVIVDPSAASFKVELQKRGFLVRDANNDVANGIRHTSALLASGRYRIHESCTHTKAEMQSYAWDKKKADRGLEEPIKANDHAADALRYLCATMIPAWRAFSA